MLKINKKNILIKLSLILVIIIQLMYIVNKKVNFSFLILTNSLKDSYGAEYILPDEIIELKRIMSDENLNRFNLSQNTIENDFLFQRFVEFLYPYKYDNNLENFYIFNNEKIKSNCILVKKYKFISKIKCWI